MSMDSFNHYRVSDLIPTRASKLATEICLTGNVLCKPDSLLYLFVIVYRPDFPLRTCPSRKIEAIVVMEGGWN
jgi:hypothetical protein